MAIYPLHLPASTGSSQPRPPSCPSELGAVARSSLGSVGMAISVQVVFDCADPPVIVRFWADALGYQLQGPPGPTAAWRAWLIEHGVLQEHRDDTSAIIDPDGSGPRIYFQRVPEPRRHCHHRNPRHRAHPAHRYQREQAPPPPQRHPPVPGRRRAGSGSPPSSPASPRATGPATNSPSCSTPNPGTWALLGFLTRTGYGTYRLNTPPAGTSSTTAPDP